MHTYVAEVILIIKYLFNSNCARGIEMMKEFSGVKTELIVGNIVNQPDIDAIVNAANAQLRIGGGVAGAIHRKGDPELEQLTRPMAPIKPGEAVITKAPNLPNRFVIHCLGPVYGRDEPVEKNLANCYKNALKLAEENSLTSIAFPAISTGAFGYPIEAAANIAFRTIKELAGSLDSVKLVRFVLFDENAYQVHKRLLENL
ncbi:macro domain-containing protein [soil metagenome]